MITDEIGLGEGLLTVLRIIVAANIITLLNMAFFRLINNKKSNFSFNANTFNIFTSLYSFIFNYRYEALVFSEVFLND